MAKNILAMLFNKIFEQKWGKSKMNIRNQWPKYTHTYTQFEVSGGGNAIAYFNLKTIINPLSSLNWVTEQNLITC
jgi:hypothetical protein